MAPCAARTCWEESQTHIAAPLWQRRSTHPARALMHAANAPRRGDHAQISSTTTPQHRQQNAQHRPHAHDQTARRHPRTHAAHTHTAQIRHPAAHAGSCAAPAAPHDQTAHAGRQTGTRCTRPCDGKAPGGHHPAHAAVTPRPPANFPGPNCPARPAGHPKQDTA